MARSLRRLCIFAAFASLLAGGMLRAGPDVDDGNGTPEPPASVKLDESLGRRAEDEESPNNVPKKVQPLPLDPESLIPRFEPEPADVAFPDSGYTPPRWLDQNYQFLAEGDPYPPGNDPFRERPGLPVGWF